MYRFDDELKSLDIPDSQMMTPLMNCVVSSNEQAFIFLYFNYGCNLNSLDKNGNTLLHLAAQANSVNIAILLKHIYKSELQSDYINEMSSTNQSSIDMKTLDSSRVGIYKANQTFEQYQNERVELNKTLNDTLDEDAITNDIEKMSCYFDLTRRNKDGHTPL